MITMNLTKKELEFATKALQDYLADLRMEIVDTDNPSYKDGLKDEDATLEALLARMRAAMQSKGTA